MSLGINGWPSESAHLRVFASRGGDVRRAYQVLCALRVYRACSSVHFLVVITTTGVAVCLLQSNRLGLVLWAELGRVGRYLVKLCAGFGWYAFRG